MENYPTRSALLATAWVYSHTHPIKHGKEQLGVFQRTWSNGSSFRTLMRRIVCMSQGNGGNAVIEMSRILFERSFDPGTSYEDSDRGFLSTHNLTLQNRQRSSCLNGAMWTRSLFTMVPIGGDCRGPIQWKFRLRLNKSRYQEIRRWSLGSSVYAPSLQILPPHLSLQNNPTAYQYPHRNW